jgi:hypothetical protein
MTIDQPRFAGRLVVLCTLLASLGAAAPGATKPPGGQARQQHVRVTVMERDGIPVRDLTIADFVVREDGAAREVLNVEAATRADHIVVLVDDSQAMAPNVIDVREGLQAFIRAVTDVAAPPRVRLTTVGDRPTVQVDFTTSADVLLRGAERVVPRPGAGATLLDAVVETARDLRTRGITGAGIVAFVVEGGQEFSDVSRQQVERTIRESGASLWAIQLATPSGPDMSGPGGERAAVLGGVTTDSGGLNRVVLSRQGIVAAFSSIGDALSASYDITYGRPDRLIPPSRIDVSTREAAHKVLASRWTPP